MAAQVALRRQQAREETEARDLSRQIQIDELVRTLQERDGLTYTAALQCVASKHQAPVVQQTSPSNSNSNIRNRNSISAINPTNNLLESNLGATVKSSFDFGPANSNICPERGTVQSK